MNKERMLQLADFLENEVPDERFDMRRYGEPHCRTAACVAGWALLKFESSLPEVTGFNLDEILGLSEDEFPDPGDVAREILGLSEDEQLSLFYVGYLDTRLEKVAEIRKMVAESVV